MLSGLPITTFPNHPVGTHTGTYYVADAQLQVSALTEPQKQAIALAGDWARSLWADRININTNQSLAAEIFSPHTCAVYAVPGPDANPVDEDDFDWLETNAEATRGEGMLLIYEQTPPHNYKRNPDVGGNAANGNPHCSWVSIKRVNIPNKQEETDCHEIVCLFMGGQSPQSNHIRSHFLQDLEEITGAVHLFGVHP